MINKYPYHADTEIKTTIHGGESATNRKQDKNKLKKMRRVSQRERQRKPLSIYQKWQVVYMSEDCAIPQCPGGPAACLRGDKHLPGEP